MKNNPLISVIMAEYNTNPADLHASIESILKQTLSDFELIIVDDCGQNDMKAMSEKFNDDRLVIIKNAKNMGLIFSLNRGIKYARADYIARMDTDDIALPQRLKKQYEFITQNSEYDVVGSRAVEFTGDQDMGILGKPGEKNKKSIMRGDSIIHPTVIMRKKAIKSVGFYPYFERAEDLALWCELLLSGCRLYVMNEILLKYRLNQEDYGKRRIRKRKGEIKARLTYYPKLKAAPKDYIHIAKNIMSGILPQSFVRAYRRRFVLRDLSTARPILATKNKKRINVLHVVGGMDMGGAETFLMNVLRAIDGDYRYRFIFLCFDDRLYDYENEIKAIGGKIVRTPDVKKVGPLKHIRQIQKIIADEDIKIVHSHTYYNSIFPLIAARKSNVKVRVTHSHNVQSELSPSLLKKAYFTLSAFVIGRYSTEFVACGNDAGIQLFGKKPFTVIHNGINIDDFTFSYSSREYYRKKLNIPNDAIVIGHVGRLEPVKNHEFLIDIFYALTKLETNSHLLLIGSGSQQDNIKQKIKALGINKQVSIINKSHEVNKLYSAMDLFAFPSLFEGMPVALVEAQANGLKCLISDEIDKSINLTDNTVFYSLSRTARQWAAKLYDMKNSDQRTVELKNDSYNISNLVKSTEKLYNLSLSREGRYE